MDQLCPISKAYCLLWLAGMQPLLVCYSVLCTLLNLTLISKNAVD